MQASDLIAQIDVLKSELQGWTMPAFARNAVLR